MEKLSREEIIGKILRDGRAEMNDEERIHQLLEQSVLEGEAEPTMGQRAADALARFAGSWGFVGIFTAVLLVWMAANVMLALRAFDPYPFILLNLVLSCVAAIQAPLIMMSQNREAERDRARAENDYRVGLKNEIILQDLHLKIDRLLEQMEQLAPGVEEKVRREVAGEGK